MKKLISEFKILGVIALSIFTVAGIAVTLQSSTTVNQSILTVKPAIPKYTLIESFSSMYSLESDIEKYIRDGVRNGYNVQSITPITGGDSRLQRAVVVMVKY